MTTLEEGAPHDQQTDETEQAAAEEDEERRRREFLEGEQMTRRRAEQAAAPRVSLKPLFEAVDWVLHERQKEQAHRRAGASARTAIDRHMREIHGLEGFNGLRRIQLCRAALDALDRRVIMRSVLILLSR